METGQLIEEVAKAKRGDKDALQILYLGICRSVYYLALRIVRNPEDADDITQEVYITIQEKIADLREPAAFYGWVNQITVNRCNRFLKKHRGSIGLDEEEILTIVDDDPMNLPDKAIDDEDTRKIILGVIDKLPDKQRVCVMLFYYAQFTVTQIADTLETNENTVKSRLALARVKIRTALEEKERKEGIKLWGIPLALGPILRQDFENFVMPEGAVERMWDNIQKTLAEKANVPDVPGDTLGQNASGMGNTGVVAQAAKAALTPAAKIIIGVIAAAVVTTGVVFGAIAAVNALSHSTPGITQEEFDRAAAENAALRERLADSAEPDGSADGPQDQPEADIPPEPETESEFTSEPEPTPEPIVINDRGNSVGNIVNGGCVAQQGDWIYFSYVAYAELEEPDAKVGLYKIRTDGTGETKLTDDTARYINVIGDWIYYSNLSDDDNLYKIRTDGTERTPLTDDHSIWMDTKHDISVIGDRIYYVDQSENGKPFTMRTDGSDRRKLSDEHGDINIADDTIYHLVYGNDDYEYEGTVLKYMRLGDSDWSTLDLEWRDWVGAINVAGDWIYCAIAYWDPEYEFWDISRQSLYKIRTDGTEKTMLDDGHISHFNVDGDWIYYGAGGLYKIRTDGTQKTRLKSLDGIGDISFINIADGWVYYSHTQDWGALFRVRTDGTEDQLFLRNAFLEQ